MFATLPVDRQYDRHYYSRPPQADENQVTSPTTGCVWCTWPLRLVTVFLSPHSPLMASACSHFPCFIQYSQLTTCTHVTLAYWHPIALLVAVACIFGQRPRKGSKDKVRSRRAQVRSSRRIQSNPETETEVAVQKPPPTYGSWIPRS
ncbi:hypothetical protein M404DRAFT_293752 [Pisolithus tinctorius Marx 270]|uniref:Uncharacterized protein n=1 Tax=Pisolithus tinctorius Marx 270 TaxID=870435 RepID=A0A0C3NKT5_PISTI|nr:hypothetical protein M404DRAFT_293752 [Pisolithus tinctorius Marx 270]